MYLGLYSSCCNPFLYTVRNHIHPFHFVGYALIVKRGLNIPHFPYFYTTSMSESIQL